jgi:hypothetical protein
MFSIGASIKRYGALPHRWACARRRQTGSSTAYRPALELLESRAMPSAAPLSLIAPLAPIASVRVADAGAPVAITITISIAVVVPADRSVLIEPVFQETLLLQPIGGSGPAQALPSAPLPAQAAIGRLSALSAPESAGLTAVPPAAAVTPASAASPPTSGGAIPGAATTTGFTTLPAGQAVAPASAAVSFAAPETGPTATPTSIAASTRTAPPPSSIGYFLGSDDNADAAGDELQEAMPAPNQPPAPADMPPASAEPARPFDDAAVPSDDGDAVPAPVPSADAAAVERVLTSDRSIALAALAAGVGLSSVAVVPEEDTSRRRSRVRQRTRGSQA